MTRRERREARAARLREWADQRDAKAAAAGKASDQLADKFPVGQPILVGHHSQRRHERAIERANAATRRSLEHTDKARDMRQRAANIEAEIDRAIYSDDEDATERLRERVAELEAQRDAMKAANAAFRREHAAALKAMSAFERERAMPHPPYELTNLGGQIRRYRKRLDALRRDAEVYAELLVIHARALSSTPRPGLSALCGADHRHGVSSTYATAHVTCADCLGLLGEAA